MGEPGIALVSRCTYHFTAMTSILGHGRGGKAELLARTIEFVTSFRRVLEDRAWYQKSGPG